MKSLILLTLSLFLATGLSSSRADEFDKVEIKTIPVAGRVTMLQGRGGNIAVFRGEKFTLLVDDQFAPLTGKIVKAVEAISSTPIRFVVNTHWHGDHTGGNENLGKAGAVIVAHDTVHKRMSKDQFISLFKKTVKAAPDGALPVITFDRTLSFRFSGETILVKFIGPAHTDTDSLVYFQDSNVIHTGDTYFAGRYPFIDTSTGGSVTGVLRALDTILELSSETTRVIPGHGRLSTPTQVRETRSMIATLLSRVERAIAEGKTDAQIVKSGMSADFDEKFGGGFISGATFLQIICDSVRQELKGK